MNMQLTIVVDVALLAQAEDLARRLGITRSALIAEALTDFLDLHGEHRDRESNLDDAPETTP